MAGVIPKQFFSAKTWVSPDAWVQLRNAAELPGMKAIAAMPDIHPGAGSPGGVVFATTACIYPKLIGGDIGCGMQLSATSIDSRVNVRRLADSLGGLDLPWDGDVAGLVRSLGQSETGYESALGTIGGGNHFLELQVLHEIHNPSAWDSLGINGKKAILLVHSGSRSFGQQVLLDHNRQADQSGVAPDSELGRSYLREHDKAVQFAEMNRRLISLRFAEQTNCEINQVLDLCHNFMESKECAGERWWLHRKGTAPSDRGFVVIPGSRSSLTYIVKPEGNGEANIFSLAHGAGRKISRTQSDEKFGKLSLDELRRPRDKNLGLDNLVICEQRDLLRQEHGKAYKDIDRVIDDMKSFGLLTVVATLRPILTYKTKADTDDGEG